ncbi:MAG: beta-glucoside-specific PTS transporter subunit IIABC [Lachnospiraceae bacterium]|nr:beta-glucoside-specific PTS transporter subunit IIABC [Lachnospiraceae bacterium]
MSVNYENTARELIQSLGGEKNVVTLTHCMTRLRFVLKDESIVDVKEVENITGVMGTMKKGGQFQVIIGNNVAKCYSEIMKIANISTGEEKVEAAPKQNVVNTVIDFIAGCMTPMIPAIIAGGLIKVILIVLGPTLFGVLAAEGDTYIILNALGDAAFYFLPIFVAITASKKLNCNMYLAVMIAGMLIYPNLITLLGGDAPTYLFGVIPVVHGSYASSIIPSMLAVILLKFVEKGVDKITPEWTKNFLKPLLIVLITGLITLVVLAPLGLIVGNGLMMAIDWIYKFAPWLAMGLFAGFMPFIVMTGMHWAFVPTTLMALANPGFDLMLLPAMLCSNIAQAGATFAVAFRSKDSKMKQIAFPAAISALLAGVTEPAMYGVTLKIKKTMYGACIASGICGIIAGIVKLKSYAFATPCLVAVVEFISDKEPKNFVYAVVLLVLSFVLSFVLAAVLANKELRGEAVSNSADKAENSAMEEKKAENVDTALCVKNPIKGKVIPLTEVNDATFSSEVLGKGYAVIPEEGKVYAPFDGKVEILMDTRHALGLTADSGINLLIHVGLETVKLNGTYFTPHVKTGDHFKAGQLLLSFEKENILKEGYDITTPVIVSNADEYDLKVENTDTAIVGEEVLHLENN